MRTASNSERMIRSTANRVFRADAKIECLHPSLLLAVLH